MTTITAAELAQRVRAAGHRQCTTDLSAMFLAYWIEHGIVEEPQPGRFRITPRGRAIASRLVEDIAPEERAA